MSLILSTLLLSSVALAASHHDHAKGLGAHEHGAIKLGMAVEGKTIDLDLDGPAESFFGFEYTPSTAKEKKAFNDAESLWTKDLLTKLFVLDKKLGCTSSEVSFKQEIDEEETKEAQAKLKKGERKESGIHSDVEAKAKIICTQDLKGQTVVVSLKKSYPHIKKLSIDLVGSEVKSINAKAVEEVKL
ncbi:DUF2796 domain-containing protein [Bacteriovorax sp. PP10]|uniref:DUF2796 domain-containing protein n=1 Tax=Bacteriovorax antarcticus TaxID=3088717 RepID=A0ABU5VTQ8_9BACT|nr:DUF2796 domain-containing protein [Bacteriovorax sp. PP10]MEA9356371.1 DUF2796 domain-containing protein [Bacteriovorax sp. PP10]